MRWVGEDILTKAPMPLRSGQTIRVCGFKIIDDFLLFRMQRTDHGTMGFPRMLREEVPDGGEYVGYLEHGEAPDHIHAWYDISEVDVPDGDGEWWWALSSEIINWQRMLDIPIECSDLFLENRPLLFTMDDGGAINECPAVGYRVGLYTTMARYSVVGPTKLGSANERYYQFDDYETAAEAARGEGGSGGIARFAIRLGEHTVVKPSHLSQTTQGNAVIVQGGSAFLVKEHDQQTPLSYHPIM